VISFDDDYRCREARYVTHNSDLPIISAYGWLVYGWRNVFEWTVERLTDWLTDRMNEWMNEWPTDWLTDCQRLMRTSYSTKYFSPEFKHWTPPPFIIPLVLPFLRLTSYKSAARLMWIFVLSQKIKQGKVFPCA
jgi:hypothetical protein